MRSSYPNASRSRIGPAARQEAPEMARLVRGAAGPARGGRRVVRRSWARCS